MAYALGKDSYWSLEEESTPGTYAANGTRCKSELISEGLKLDVETLTDPSLSGARSPRGVYAGATKMLGPLGVRANYEGAIMKLFKAALGSSASAVVGGETYVRDHTIKEGATIPSHSIEMAKGNLPAGKVIRGLGALVETLDFSVGVGADSFARVNCQLRGTDLDPGSGTPPAGHNPTTSFTVASCTLSGSSAVVTTSGDFLTYGANGGVKVGMAVTGTGVTAGSYVGRITSATSITLVDAAGAPLNITTPGTVTLTFTLSYPFLLPILGKQVVTLSNGVDTWTYPGGAGRVRSVKVTINNPLEDRPYLGSQQPDTPAISELYEVTWEMLEEFQDLGLYKKARDYTDTAPKIVLRDSVGIGSAAFRELELRSNKCRCTYDEPVDKRGVLLATSTHKAYYDTADASQLVVRFRNLDGSV